MIREYMLVAIFSFPAENRVVLLYLMIDRFGFETRESHKYKPASIFEPND